MNYARLLTALLEEEAAVQAVGRKHAVAEGATHGYSVPELQQWV